MRTRQIRQHFIMQRLKIDNTLHPAFPAFWNIYSVSFPLNEQRQIEEQKRILALPAYHVEAWEENGRLLGFLTWWRCQDLRYIEHYAIHPAYRSAGHGSVFLSEWMKENDVPAILEIEPAEDEITRRRENFYLRLGFRKNNFEHWHPSYNDGSGRVDLWIMTYPEPVSADTYNAFRQKFWNEIIPKF